MDVGEKGECRDVHISAPSLSVQDTSDVIAAVPGPPAPPASGATLVGALLSLDYWLVFVALIIGAGAALAVINSP